MEGALKPATEIHQRAASEKLAALFRSGMIIVPCVAILIADSQARSRVVSRIASIFLIVIALFNAAVTLAMGITDTDSRQLQSILRITAFMHLMILGAAFALMLFVMIDTSHREIPAALSYCIITFAILIFLAHVLPSFSEKQVVRDPNPDPIPGAVNV